VTRSSRGLQSRALDPSDFFKSLGFVVAKTGDAQTALAMPGFKRNGEPYLLVAELGGRPWIVMPCELGRYTGLSPWTYGRGFASPASINAATISSH
jgi:hypothetical protein